MKEFFSAILYYPFLNLLTFFVWVIPGHFAATGIILLTLLVRFALMVPSRKQAEAARKTAQLAPLLEELKKEYGDDRQGLAQAQMDLYKKNDISPFGSCLPVLIQFPILIILYNAIRNGLTIDNPHLYSWMPRPEFINTNFFGINLTTPDHTYVLPIIAALLQYVQVKLTLPPTQPRPAGSEPDPTAAMNKTMPYIAPALTLFFSISLPAGIALYWIVSTIFTIVQQRAVNRTKFEIGGVAKALETADKKHPEHKPRTKKVLEEIADETKVTKGVTVTVRKKK